MPFTSTYGSSLDFFQTNIQVGNSASPPVFTTIANIENLALPINSRTVETTNVGDNFARRHPTLNDMGKITFNIFWIPLEPTHKNTSGGLRYMQLNRVLGDWLITYNDGAMSPSTDSFPAYVTNMGISSKTADVYHGAVELSNDGAPTLV